MSHCRSATKKTKGRDIDSDQDQGHLKKNIIGRRKLRNALLIQLYVSSKGVYHLDSQKKRTVGRGNVEFKALRWKCVFDSCLEVEEARRLGVGDKVRKVMGRQIVQHHSDHGEVFGCHCE